MSDMTASACLKRYQLGRSAIYIVGAFNKGITVFSQQVRALNLVWALIEGCKVNLDTEDRSGSQSLDPSRKQIAIVGAGFAGLTVAAGLLKNRVNADITVFEQRDTVLPLQQGCDTRWLHPHIYDWPNPGSEAFSAALPVLNWTANRASDVVVQILKEWHDVAYIPQDRPKKTKSKPPETTMYCNTRYLQISKVKVSSKLAIEWIGEARTPYDPAVPADGQASPIGDSKEFDIVVLAVGFGLETGTQNSYWRNETCAQPHLGQARSTYIVSGAGDGALIDLCRLRIAHFRQDRILAELFVGCTKLLRHLRATPHLRDDGLIEIPEVWRDGELKRDTDKVLSRLRERLRQDTTVLLRVLEPSFDDLFTNQQVSFQNRLLAYLLYRCGAFTLVGGKPDNSDLDPLAEEHGVPDERIIVRHGTQKKEGFAKILPKGLSDTVAKYIKEPASHDQTDQPLWSGGYFDMPGMRAKRDRAYQPSDKIKSYWRRDYLPSPTEAVATAFCSAIAGFIPEPKQSPYRLRVTLHRRLISGDEIVLQQCCAYQGVNVEKPEPDTPGPAGRTFPSSTGTIGAAYTLRKIIHSKRDATKEALQKDMEAMKLSDVAREMSGEVASVAAIPLLAKAADQATNPLLAKAADEATKDPVVVLGVLYLESYGAAAFVDDTLLNQLVRMCNRFLDSLPEVSRTAGIANTDFWRHGEPRESGQPRPDPDTWDALWPAKIRAPYTKKLRYLNFDFSDFTLVDQT